MSELIFRSFASGSSGNCYYLGNHRQGILIDAGISARTIRSCLKEMNLDFYNIMGVLVTHDHADHIRAVGTIGERFHVPIYATKAVHEGIDHNYGVVEKLKTSRKFIEKGVPFEICGMTVNSFTISHDSTDCVSYVIDFEGERFMIATDVGCVDDTLRQYVSTANHLVIEANHDEQMLLNGPYPSYLKSRILSDRGHMSNYACGCLISVGYSPKLKNIWLCHLSQENNDPQVALQTIRDCLSDVGINPDSEHLNIVALDRLTPSPVYQLI